MPSCGTTAGAVDPDDVGFGERLALVDFLLLQRRGEQAQRVTARGVPGAHGVFQVVVDAVA
jgi:hypothetical protein